MMETGEVGAQKLPLKVYFITCFDEVDRLILVEQPPGCSVSILKIDFLYVGENCQPIKYDDHLGDKCCHLLLMIKLPPRLE